MSGSASVGKMDSADIFIAGVYTNGFSYAMDMHGVGNVPLMDDRQDWHLLEATENSTHTIFNFWRLLDTCDDHDYAITNDTARVIYKGRRTLYHGGNRGTTSFNFIPATQPEWDPAKYTRFDVTTNFTTLAEETSYWCMIHGGPQIISKNHIVAFEAFLNNETAKKYTHHFVLTMSNAPDGQNATELFEPFVGTKGKECYAMPENQTLPFEHCREYLYTTHFPEHVGYPFGEDGNEIYYMLGLSFYYTSELRPNDAGLMWTPHDWNMALIVPPETPGFVISTHCAPGCTERFPIDGISIFNVLLHSHIAGRKTKFRHFRNNVELSWILSDGNYDFNFQQNVHLWEEAKILPGDQMTVECMFESTGRKGTVVNGGYSTRDEMFEAVFWYYPKIKVSSCGSVYPLPTALRDYGVTNYTMAPITSEITMPWAYGQHEYHYSVDDEDTYFGNVQYPYFQEEYQPHNPCISQN